MKMKTIALGLLTILALTGCGKTETPTTPSRQSLGKPVEKQKILALGDSLTEGYRVDKSDSYPSQLQALLDKEGYHYEVINSGISGETSTGLRERLNWTLSQEPDIIILTTGANDAMRGVNLSITEENISAIIEAIQAQDIQIVFGGMEIYQNLGGQYTRDFKNMYPRIAKKYDLPFIPFFLEGVAGKPQFNISDQIHPNKDGYTRIVEKNIWPVLKPLLEK